MKKKLFVFVVLAMVLVACKPAVKGGGTSNSETPLELTAANLAGRWVLEGDSSKWYEFKKDKTFTSDTVTTTNNGTFFYFFEPSRKIRLSSFQPQTLFCERPILQTPN